MKKKLLLQDLSEYIAQQEGISKKDAEAFTRAFFEVIEQGLLEDKFVKVKGFGTFKLVSVSERESVNINTGERFQISGHTKISFTPDNNMKELVNRPFAHFETVDLSEDTDTSEFDSIDMEMEAEEFDSSSDENSDQDAYEDLNESTYTEPNSCDNEELLNEADSTNDSSTNDLPADNIDKEFSSNEEPSQKETSETTESNTEIEGNTESSTNNVSNVASHIKTTGIHPTPIVPESEDHSSQSETTAKIKIDDTDDEFENEKSNDCSESPAYTEKSDTSEKSVDEIVVTSPQTITPNSGGCMSSTMGYSYCEVPSRRKVNWWKRAVIMLIIVMLMSLSYIVGYYRLLCPCVFDCEGLPTSSLPNNTIHPDSLTSSSPQNDTTKRPQIENKDTLNNKSKVSTDPLKTETTAVSPRERGEKLQEHKKEKKPQKKDTKQENAVPTQQPRTHVVRVGDNLSKISRKYYGSDAYIPKIIKYNNLKDANNIPLGMKLRLP